MTDEVGALEQIVEMTVAALDSNKTQDTLDQIQGQPDSAGIFCNIFGLGAWLHDSFTSFEVDIPLLLMGLILQKIEEEREGLAEHELVKKTLRQWNSQGFYEQQ